MGTQPCTQTSVSYAPAPGPSACEAGPPTSEAGLVVAGGAAAAVAPVADVASGALSAPDAIPVLDALDALEARARVARLPICG